jgi:hypothetical protein
LHYIVTIKNKITWRKIDQLNISATIFPFGNL